MCLILIAYRQNPGVPFALVANRDEFYHRATEQAHVWPERSATGGRLLAGRDQVAGGTWLGITSDGRFAAVTNFREVSVPKSWPRSRGDLVRGYLLADSDPMEYLRAVSQRASEYAGFNLLVGDLDSLLYFSNRPGRPQAGEIQLLKPGIYGLSNSVLDSPWPKVRDGKDALKRTIDRTIDTHKLFESRDAWDTHHHHQAVHAQPSTQALIQLMQRREVAQDHELPETGIPLELERALSPPFIISPERDYGTRCTTAMVMTGSRRVLFNEQNYDSSGEVISKHFFDFPLG